jgi:DNA helicase-2/ATP-dependent DNA helicase PcrA
MASNAPKLTLNKAQQQAVDHIYGPLLVLAGPGTGKTQLLSARIANILQKTDANAQNILCLTFTESAAQNMRERLVGLIRDDAYDVHINTYHGFGSDIIRSFPEYFEDIDLETGKDNRLERPIDDLQALQIISDIINRLPYSSPLIGARHFPKQILSTISELKRGLYTPDSLRALAQQNIHTAKRISKQLQHVFEGVVRMPSKSSQAIELFSHVQEALQQDDELARLASEELETALHAAAETASSKPLTAWKNTWLAKDEHDRYVFTDQSVHERMAELANIYSAYQETTAQKGLYDFDDMILRTIEALKTHNDLRYTLQEKYQFILLDEFQDTNAAQFELVKLLADNPVHEGQPNIFAVGDDDQAIYAFQGARVSNMLQFTESFRGVVVINLTENYRSHEHILHVAHNIAGQIESRLHYNLEGIQKVLSASSKTLPKQANIERHEFDGEANEYAWVAHRIHTLIAGGVSPHEIAILAPQHKYLERIVPCLVKEHVPLTYEKREDILQTQLLRTLRSMAELLLAINTQDNARINELMPQVLSLDFYHIPVEEIWQVNWQKNKEQDTQWAEIALQNEQLAPHVKALLHLGMLVHTEPLEYILDYLVGTTTIQLDAENSYFSPLKQHYFEQPANTLLFYELLTNLSTIREHVRALQAGQDQLLTTADFVAFIVAHEQAEQPLINTHPIAQSTDSVQLMTTYKAKGLEFEHVFLLSLHDDVWGKKARGGGNKLSLPANLKHIRYAGSSEDELRRLLFVAITRAKIGLYLTSHATKDTGKATEPVKYLQEFTEQNVKISSVLPRENNTVIHTTFSSGETMQAVETMWFSRHIMFDTTLLSLLQERLSRYVMSPTHLNTFIDTEYGGPAVFLLHTLLRFPQAPGADGEFGNAMHATLDWAQKHSSEVSLPTLLKRFDTLLNERYIPKQKMADYRSRGHEALRALTKDRPGLLQQPAKSEVDFRNEGVVLGNAKLTGKIDRLEIDEANKAVHIVDFKTGSPATKWDTSLKLQKYKQQLYFYKLLIEGSHSWNRYKVASARLEFVEPLSSGSLAPPLYVQFSDKEQNEVEQLIADVWQKIMTLDLL